MSISKGLRLQWVKMNRKPAASHTEAEGAKMVQAERKVRKRFLTLWDEGAYVLL